MIYKICKKCLTPKELKFFSKLKSGKYGRQSHCKICFKEKYADNRPITDELRVQKREYMRRIKLNNPMTLRKHDWKRQNISITEEEYHKIYELQKGSCGACGRNESEFDKKLSVDHCHTTGAIRGLLCRDCNMGIGFLKYNADYIEGAAKYIRNTSLGIKNCNV